MPKVFWGILPERCVYDLSFEVGLRVADRAARKGFFPIYAQYGRTDITRQAMCDFFLANTNDPADTLVMLDVDHDHPPEIVERLAAHTVPVVAALAFRRCEPFQACAFRRDPASGELRHLATFPPGLHAMAAVGTGAIAIKRGALEQLQHAGHEWFFKYEYSRGVDGLIAPSEDLYFSKICEEVGVGMFVDTTIETPHITLSFIDRQTHDGYWAGKAALHAIGQPGAPGPRQGRVISPDIVTRLEV